MGFFGELKQDLSQAVNELMPGEETDTEDTNIQETNIEDADIEAVNTGDTGGDERSLGEMLENIDNISLTDDEAVLPNGDLSFAGEETDLETDSSESSIDLESMLEDVLAEEQNAQMPEYDASAQFEAVPVVNEKKGDKKIMDTFSGVSEAVDETSVITMGMTITGDICSEGSVDIIGNVNGNIELRGKLNVTGHINGNSKAAEIFADGAKINGEIVSEGAIKVGASTVIIGNITATSAAIAGAVKGDIDVRGPVVLDASAIVMGNIKSKSVQINNGAVIEGMCSQCYADVSPTAFFDDYKPELKKVKASK
ncbi:MAG: polymer-forming cytoskeletal protein [Lachnospiraceae bacterium]|nr:polymer-forming cytoskeletal protein [Lachnospiraceae bacterium]